MIRMLILLLTLTIPSLLMAIEEPSYGVVATLGDVEFRLYKPYVVARTSLPLEMERNEAASTAFFMLFKYIQGANTASTKIAMTAPVIQDSGTKISMTAPVIQDASTDAWNVAFVLPAQYAIENAPVPTDQRVKLLEIPERLVASIKYSGRWTESNVVKYTDRLMSKLAEANVEPSGPAGTAYYNAPYVPAFLRRNEIIVPVSSLPRQQ